MGAARRKGKWAGGQPVLGYDVVDSKLVVDELEADRVREIFGLYLEHGSLLDVVREANRRGWTTKRWTTKKGTTRGGKAFTKTSLHSMLTNVVYVGRVRYQDKDYEGEHDGIVEPDVFDQVQKLLVSHGRTATRGHSGAVLAGLIRCRSCGCAMTHTYTARKGRRYRYYVCVNAQKRGYEACPSPSVSAPEAERLVVDQIRAMGRDPALVRHTVAHVAQRAEEQTRALERENELVAEEIRRAYDELSQVSVQPGSAGRMADIQEQIDAHQRRLAEIRDQLDVLESQRIDPEEIEQALARFDPVWESLTPREQHRVLHLLIERVEFDGGAGEMTVTFHPAGIRTLLEREEAA